MVSVGVIRVQCDACKQIITGKYIHFADGTIFCRDCYSTLPKCKSCKKPVVGGEDQTIDGLCPLCYKKAPKCSICNKAIIGSYTRFVDRSIACDNCMQKYVKCDRCSKPVPVYTSIRGKVLCKYCLVHAPRCSVCSNPIIGTYWIINNMKICSYCYKIYERCDLCGIPSQFLFTVYDKKICYNCQEQAKRCSSCGLPIIGRFYSYKNQNGIYCENCETYSPHCDSCGRPVGMKYFQISDGRKICLECQRSAVKTDEQLYELIGTAIEGLNELGMTIDHNINFRLISKRLLDSRIEKSGAETTAGKNLGLFERKDEKINIYIQSHLPVQLALGTLCHELAHAWQSEKISQTDQSLVTREGFCEWVSYKVLMKYGFQGQAEMIANREDLYGQGFQKFREFEHKFGIKQLLEWVKTIR